MIQQQHLEYIQQQDNLLHMQRQAANVNFPSSRSLNKIPETITVSDDELPTKSASETKSSEQENFQHPQKKEPKDLQIKEETIKSEMKTEPPCTEPNSSSTDKEEQMHSYESSQIETELDLSTKKFSVKQEIQQVEGSVSSFGDIEKDKEIDISIQPFMSEEPIILSKQEVAEFEVKAQPFIKKEPDLELAGIESSLIEETKLCAETHSSCLSVPPFQHAMKIQNQHKRVLRKIMRGEEKPLMDLIFFFRE